MAGVVARPLGWPSSHPAWVPVPGGTPERALWTHPPTRAHLVWPNSAFVSMPNPAPAPWRVAATGDLDRDGAPDYVWYNPATTQVIVWLMDPTGAHALRAADFIL